jgi:hypothetical protein
MFYKIVTIVKVTSVKFFSDLIPQNLRALHYKEPVLLPPQKFINHQVGMIYGRELRSSNIN